MYGTLLSCIGYDDVDLNSNDQGLPLASAVIGIVGYIQYPGEHYLSVASTSLLLTNARIASLPAEPVSRLDRELGYPCYVPDVEGWTEKTVIYLGRDVRAYVSLVTTTCA